MNSFTGKIRARLGDFWFYSLMLFVACRSGDVIQAFIGLWLVPRYVSPTELGAVMPLQQLCGFFAMPLTIIATVFTKFVNTYATRGDYGKLKGLTRDVLALSSGIFLLCIIAAYLLLPHFYERIAVVSGSLTILILASGFIGGISGLIGSVVQGLKKFNVMTVQAIMSAPIRLATLLVAMPFRPLSGYILGQTTPAGTTGLLAAITVYRELRTAPTDKSWRNDLPAILRYLLPFACYTILSATFGTITATVYRQRLPEIESAAYYMLSRFAEITGYVGSTMTVVLFPLASEAHERGKENLKILINSILGSLAATAVLIILFSIAGTRLFSICETWHAYTPYAYILPWMTLLSGIGVMNGLALNYEFAAQRFRLAFITLFISILQTAFFVCFMGCDFFRGILPDSTVGWMKACHIAQLSTLTYISIGCAGLQFCIIAILLLQKRLAIHPCH